MVIVEMPNCEFSFATINALRLYIMWKILRLLLPIGFCYLPVMHKEEYLENHRTSRASGSNSMRQVKIFNHRITEANRQQ